MTRRVMTNFLGVCASNLSFASVDKTASSQKGNTPLKQTKKTRELYIISWYEPH